MCFHRTLAVLTLSALVGCVPQGDVATPTTQSLTLRLDSTQDTARFVLDVGRAYVTAHPHVTILTEVEAVISAQAPPPHQERLLITYYHIAQSDSWAVPLALDGMVFVVNNNIGIHDLPLSAIRAIYQGTFTSWAQLGGADVPIVPIIRHPESDLQQEFQRLIMGQRRITPNARLVNTPQQAHNLSAQMTGAIMFTTLSQWHTQDEQETASRLLLINGIMANTTTLRERRYALPLTLFATSTQPASEPYEKLLIWLQSPPGQGVFEPYFSPLP